VREQGFLQGNKQRGADADGEHGGGEDGGSAPQRDR